MQKFPVLIVAIAIVAFCLSSCSKKVYFTPEIKASLEENKVPLTSLQFYARRNLRLKRSIDEKTAKAKNGEAVIKKGTSINVVKLSRRTPGALVASDNQMLKVAFEEGENKGIVFKKLSSGLYVLDRLPNNHLMYDGYMHSLGVDSSQVLLQIKRKVIKKINIDKRKMKGKKV